MLDSCHDPPKKEFLKLGEIERSKYLRVKSNALMRGIIAQKHIVWEGRLSWKS